MREWKGVVWGFSWLGATCWRFCCKTQDDPAKYVYCVHLLCTVYSFPPVAETCARLAGNLCQYLTTVTSGANSWVWVTVCYFTGTLASRVGQGGGVGQICLHDFTQPYTIWPRWREQGGGPGVVFPPLVNSYCRSIVRTLQDNGEESRAWKRTRQQREIVFFFISCVFHTRRNLVPTVPTHKLIKFRRCSIFRANNYWEWPPLVDRLLFATSQDFCGPLSCRLNGSTFNSTYPQRMWCWRKNCSHLLSINIPDISG